MGIPDKNYGWDKKCGALTAPHFLSLRKVYFHDTDLDYLGGEAMADFVKEYFDCDF